MTMEAIIFDLDGTLWDACENTAKAWNEYITHFCPDTHVNVTVESLASCMGLRLREFGARIFTDVDEDRAMEIGLACAEYENHYLAEHGAIIYPGVPEALESLSKKYKLFIVSNCESGYIETFLQYYHLEEYITDTMCPGDTGKDKAENIQLIMEKNQLKQAVYVGDTQKDYDEATRAGVPFIWAAYGFGEVSGTKRIEDVRELEEML